MRARAASVRARGASGAASERAARPAIQRCGEVMRTGSAASGESDGEGGVREGEGEGVHWRG